MGKIHCKNVSEKIHTQFLCRFHLVWCFVTNEIIFIFKCSDNVLGPLYMVMSQSVIWSLIKAVKYISAWIHKCDQTIWKTIPKVAMAIFDVYFLLISVLRDKALKQFCDAVTHSLMNWSISKYCEEKEN